MKRKPIETRVVSPATPAPFAFRWTEEVGELVALAARESAAAERAIWHGANVASLLRELPELLRAVDAYAHDVQSVMAKRYAQTAPRIAQYDAISARLRADADDLQGLMNPDWAPEIVAELSACEDSMRAAAIQLTTLTAAIWVKKPRRGKPIDHWAEQCRLELATLWLLKGWKPTANRQGALARVLRVLLESRDQQLRRPCRERDAVDGLRSSVKLAHLRALKVIKAGSDRLQSQLDGTTQAEGKSTSSSEI